MPDVYPPLANGHPALPYKHPPLPYVHPPLADRNYKEYVNHLKPNRRTHKAKQKNTRNRQQTENKRKTHITNFYIPNHITENMLN